MSTGENIKTLPGDGYVRLSYSPDGTTLASGSGSKIHLFDVSTGMPLRTLSGGHACNIMSIAFSPDGRTIATGNSNSTIFLFDVSDVSTGTHIKTLTGHWGYVESVLFSPDGNTLASRGSGLGGIRLWDVSTRTHIRTLTDTFSFKSMSFSPDGNTITGGGGDGTIFLWDVSTGENIRTLSAGHWSRDVESIAFSPDGNTLASGGGGWEQTIHLWDVSTGENIKILTGHTGDVYSVAFSPDGTTLASESRDGTILLWELNPTQTADVNNDGVVNITDLTLVASNFGAKGANPADVNGDGVVNTKDFLIVAVAFENADADAAPTLWRLNTDEILTRENVEKWLNAARQPNLTDPHFQRGIQVLENLLKVLTPKATALLPNYPNPFNPETWIPYQLAKPAEVTLRIYTANGKVVRKLAIGQQPAGMYQEKNRAAYWDGKNAQGEPVSSGVYFYSITAGDFSATRKMLIRK